MTDDATAAPSFSFAPMTLAEAREIADEWRYPAPYDFYDADADEDDYAELVDPGQWPELFLAVRTADGRLAGFVTGERSEAGGSEMTLGLRPDLTGHGLGLAFLLAGLDALAGAGLPDPVELDVAAFNERAIAVYERAGFRRIAAFDQATNGSVFPFISMRRGGAPA